MNKHAIEPCVAQMDFDLLRDFASMARMDRRLVEGLSLEGGLTMFSVLDRCAWLLPALPGTAPLPRHMLN
jgi:hypothetical protein